MRHEPLHRYAVYWAPPPTHTLWTAGCAWLGRSADGRADTPAPDARDSTNAARRYGFHATLKAPVVLHEGTSEADFLQAVFDLARRSAAFDMPKLQVAWLRDCLALRPVDALGADHPLRRLADDCVRTLDPWRAPSSASERERRSAGRTLSTDALALLERWGDADVFDEWRFHLTLSDALAERDPRSERLWTEACDAFGEALAVPLRCDAVCVFVEPAPGEPFVLAHRFAFGA